MPGHNPCCDSCTFCHGPYPDQVSVTIAGLANAGCASCDFYNGTFVLTKVAECSAWNYNFPFPPGEPCGLGTGGSIGAIITLIGGVYSLTVSLAFPGFLLYGTVVWTKTFASKPMCAQHDLDVPFAYDDPFAPNQACTGAASTCTLSAA
jgi:hypothetical protein